MNWILKNKKILCLIKSFFGSDRIKNISQNKKTKVIFIGLVLFCIFIPQVSSAALSDWNPLKVIADNTIGLLMVGVQGFMVFLIGIATTIFGYAVDPANISGSSGILNQSAIKDVWIMVRDTLNMFFILVLLFSAFCTIFQVEKWNLKKLWMSILINALLVNFSFPIARFFIDISNVAMYYFINNIFGSAVSGANIFAVFSSNSQLSKILFPDGFKRMPISYELAMIVFTFILAITLLVIAILFMVRLAALAILVMFSPLGFVGYIFPSTSGFADRWWKELFSYAFFGPIMIFVLAIALKILEAVGKNTVTVSTLANGQAVDAGQSTFIASAALFSIPIILLWMGMSLGKSMGIAGAETVVGAGQKFAKWLPKVGAKKFERDYLAKDRSIGGKHFNLSPRAFLKGWNARTEEAENKAIGVAAGGWHDNLNGIFRTGKTDYKMLAEHQVVAKRQKELSEVSEESEVLLAQAGKLLGNKSAIAQTDLQAIFRTLISNNDHDELMDWIRNNVQDFKGGNAENNIGKQLDAMGFNEKNWDVSGGNTANAVDILLEKSGLDKDHRDQHLIDLGNIAAGKGGIMFGAAGINKKGEYERHFTVDKSTGAVDDSEMADLAAKKIMTTPDAQAIPKSMHRNHFTDQAKELDLDKDGKIQLDTEGNTRYKSVAHLNEHGKAMLRHYASPTAIEQSGRHKPDFSKSVGGDAVLTKQMHDYAKSLHDTGNKEQAIKASSWTAAIQRRAGVSEEAIKAQIAGAFGRDEATVNDIMKKSFGPVKNEEKEKKVKSSAAKAAPYKSKGINAAKNGRV